MLSGGRAPISNTILLLLFRGPLLFQWRRPAGQVNKRDVAAGRVCIHGPGQALQRWAECRVTLTAVEGKGHVLRCRLFVRLRAESLQEER